MSPPDIDRMAAMLVRERTDDEILLVVLGCAAEQGPDNAHALFRAVMRHARASGPTHRYVDHPLALAVLDAAGHYYGRRHADPDRVAELVEDEDRAGHAWEAADFPEVVDAE